MKRTVHITLLFSVLLTQPLQAERLQQIAVCTDFGCNAKQYAQLSSDHWQQIQALFDSLPDAAAERVAIGHAIGLFEITIGRQTGTWRDKAFNWQRAGEAGELDCIAESTNTHQYLTLLESAGLLRWHRVLKREMRGVLFVHWTAVLEDISDSKHWAVDSWFRDNGQPPVIIPLTQWHAYKEPDT